MTASTRILTRGIIWGQDREDAADAAQVRQFEREIEVMEREATA